MPRPTSATATRSRSRDGAQRQLAADAADLRLPAAAEALPAVEAALEDYLEAQARLCHAADALRQALPELERQGRRVRDALDDLRLCNERCADCRIEAEQADARLAVLREAIGAKVKALKRKLSQARTDVTAGEQRIKDGNARLRDCAERRAVAGAGWEAAGRQFERRSAERAAAVAAFQRFVATGLLQAAWPEAPLPESATSWTIDPALNLARRTEQALSEIRYDMDAWDRVQKEVAGDVTELQRALSARGHVHRRTLPAPVAANERGGGRARRSGGRT